MYIAARKGHPCRFAASLKQKLSVASSTKYKDIHDWANPVEL